MVLPANTILRPGDALQSKPKQAMFVRMSSETLDALQSFPTQPVLQFQFGNSPGIYIGDTYFPMRYSEETTQNDLYLRTSSSTKKNAPLKLYANVVGRFSVERELADGLREKIRESTQDAVNQRNSRTTVFIENPPDLPSTSSKKRKEPPASMFRKPLRPSDKLKPAPAPAPVNKLPTVQRDTPISPHRKHIVRLLAVKERTEEDIINNLNSSEKTLPGRREIQDLLEQLADFTPLKPGSADNARGLYCLKPIAWKEVRPYEWTELTEQQRTVVARVARIKFQSLGIPESDPTWDHVRYRSPAVNISSSSGQSKASSSAVPEVSTMSAQNKDVQKRAVSSREGKEKILKSTSDPKMEIKVKETRVTSRSTYTDAIPKDARSKDTPKSRRMADSTPVESPAGRKHAPVSAKAAKGDVRLNASNDPRASTSASKVPPARKTEKGVDPSTLLPSKHSTSRVEDKAPLLQKFKKLPRDNEIAESDKDSRSSSQITRTSTKESTGLGNDDSYEDRKPSQLKRKNVEQDRDRAANIVFQPILAKRRKTESESTGLSREDRSESGKRLDMDPRTREKSNGILSNASKPTRTKDATSAPKRHPLSNEKISSGSPSSSNTRTASSQGGKVTSTKKNPRRSPIYTSSEEGGEEEDVPLKTPAPTRPSNPAVASSGSTAPRRSRNTASRPLPIDHSALRARYNTSYLEYLTSFQRLVIQKGKIDRLLKNSDLESIGSLTDSEGDVELLDPEELSQLAIKHKRLEEELEAIQEIFRVGSPV